MNAVRKLVDRIGGPAISMILHGIILLVLVNMVVSTRTEQEREIEIQVVDAQDGLQDEPPSKKLDELAPDEQVVMSDDATALPDAPPNEFSDDSVDLSGLAIAASESPVVLTGLFAGRTDAARAERLQTFAGGYGDQVEAAVLRALTWLASQQTSAGHWGEVSKYNKGWHTRKWTASLEQEQRATRLTSLCLLAFLAHGETPQSPEFGAVVQRAIDYLRSQQHPETGLFVPITDKHSVKGGEDLGVYAHAQATYALAEAYALTRAPALKAPVERAVRVMMAGQLASGAWGNWYAQDISDSSATSWQIQALKAAQAAGIQIDGLAAAMSRAVEGINYLYKGEGAWFYRKGAPIKTWNSGGPIMSGAMVLSLQLLGLQGDPMVQAGLRYLNDFGMTEWDDAWANPINKSLPATYEWYYNTQAVFQRGGSRWKRWNADFAPMLIGNQDAAGWWRGPGQSVGEETIYSTSLCALALQVYYRILPSFQEGAARAPQVTFEHDVVIKILDSARN